MMQREVEQKNIRKDGKIPIISIEANNLAEATHQTIIACHDYGCRVETPKQKSGMTLGYDANITVRVNNPDSEPKVCFPGMHDSPLGVMQYILEVTHGIHNHWKKNSEHPEWWGYTYNERFVEQIPFVFQRIKKDWDDKKRISGRDYQFAIWRAGEDIILEQEDPPCWQLGQLRFLDDSNGNVIMNYQTDWRSRDLLKAWNENNIGQIELMKLLARKTADIIQTPVELGVYIDHSSSLHLYGLYVDRDNLEKQIGQMKRDGYEARSMSLDDYLENRERLKRIIAAQSLAESKGWGLNQPEELMREKGLDADNIRYPEEWDTWPKSWDAEPDRRKLAKVNPNLIDKIKTALIIKRH